MYQKNFPAELEILYTMLEFIQVYGQKHQISPISLDQMILAAEEALVNIISYGYPDGKKGTIEIVCESSSPQPGIKIIIKDQGVPFNPIEKAPKLAPSTSTVQNETEVSLGGYGIHILIGLMDKVEYQRLDNGNMLILTKYAKEQHSPKKSEIG